VLLFVRAQNTLSGSRACNDTGAIRDTAALLWSLVFGSLGFGFFLYGKKQHAVVPLVCGLGLMTIPYVVSNLLLLITLGVTFIILPYFVSI